MSTIPDLILPTTMTLAILTNMVIQTTRQYLRVATLINLANLPTPVNLAISAKPAILALLSTTATLANPGNFFLFLLLKLLNR